MPAAPVLPIVQSGGLEQIDQILQHRWLSDDHLVQGGHSGRLQHPGPSKTVGIQLGPRSGVVHGLHVAGAHLVPVLGRHGGLQSHDLISVGVRQLSDRQRGGDVIAVLGQDRGVLFEAVVLLVGQPDAVLTDEQRVAARISGIGVHAQSDGGTGSAADAASEVIQQVVDAGDGLDLCQQRCQGFESQRRDPFGVHEAGVQHLHQVRLGAGCRTRQPGHDLLDCGFGGVAQVDECAGGLFVFGDGCGGEPAAIHMTEQIVGRANGRVKVECGHRVRLSGGVDELRT